MKMVRLVVVAVAILGFTACGGHKLNAPEPGSLADTMCDTNETGPGIVFLNGKHYVQKCLNGYPWTK